MVTLSLFPKGIRPGFGVGWGKGEGERNSKYIWKNCLHLGVTPTRLFKTGGNCVFLL